MLVINAAVTFPENECCSEIPKSIWTYFDTNPSGFEKGIDIESLKGLEELYRTAIVFHTIDVNSKICMGTAKFSRGSIFEN
jgi:hypothetical protein